MNVRLCSRQPILQFCSPEGHTYQIDPYIGCEHLCYYCYALNQAETDWTREILTYRDIVAHLSEEFAGLEPQSIYMGWVTDPYQPAERVQRQTRDVLEVLASKGHSVCILTKSGLVARDVGLLATMPGSSAGVSLVLQDEQVRQLFEASAPPNEQRIGAPKVLKEAGIRTYALICPVMPFITDVRRLVEMVASWADTRGTREGISLCPGGRFHRQAVRRQPAGRLSRSRGINRRGNAVPGAGDEPLGDDLCAAPPDTRG